MRDYLDSMVPGHEGPCRPTWLNMSEIYRRFGGNGYYTGYFKLVKPFLFGYRKYGKEFHGYIKGSIVYSTEDRP
jgi:hypothetical protein